MKHLHCCVPAENLAEITATESVGLPGAHDQYDPIGVTKRVLPPYKGCRYHQVPKVFSEGAIPTAQSFGDTLHRC